MSEGKDPAIKLFGKVIQCQWPPPHEERFGASGSEPSAASVDDLDSEHNCSSDQNRNRSDDKSASTELADSKQDTVSSHTVISERKDAAAASSAITDIPNEESSSLPSSKKEDQSETSTSQEKKPLKKPDKIIPCPRCNSMDTKFCYFNNYNVNQPRHFCKNCQRYWTAGGTMRNVPVGAGRRRNKSSSASNQHNRHLLIHDAFQTARPGSVVGGIVHHPTLRTANGTILAFGSDFPLCESMASALNLGENSLNCMPNGFFRSDQQHQGYQLSSGGPIEGSGDQSSGSCWSVWIPAEKGGNESEPAMKMNLQGTPVPLHQAPCFQETPWSYPWNPSTQWSSTPGQPSPFLHSGIPMSFYPSPPPYWGCGMPGGSWKVPWTSPASISSDQSSTSCTSPNSPLGKHSRDGSDDNETERRVLVPKTLRIDDPNEAAKSSIWATLGISKNEKENSVHRGGRLFEGFQLAYNERNSDAGKSLSLLETNPAAMSRSLTFQETAK